MGQSWRWSPRSRQVCEFCARLHWRETLRSVFLAGENCFMAAPEAGAELLAWEKYHRHWPLIPAKELQASCVNLRLGTSEHCKLVLLHKRRVTAAQARGDEEVFVCQDCHDAVQRQEPQMCKYALVNHMWLGR